MYASLVRPLPNFQSKENQYLPRSLILGTIIELTKFDLKGREPYYYLPIFQDLLFGLGSLFSMSCSIQEIIQLIFYRQGYNLKVIQLNIIQMILASIQTLDFSVDEKIQSFMIANPKQTPILFKVKTNNVNAIDAKPFAGFLQPKSNTKITVKRNGNSSDQVKILIGYTQCPEELTKENIKELWNKYSKNQQSEIITIRILKKSQNKEQKSETKTIPNVQQQKENQLYMSIRKQEEKGKEEFTSQLQIEEKNNERINENPNLSNSFYPQEKKEQKSEKKAEVEVVPGPKVVKVGNVFEISPLVFGILLTIVFALGYSLGESFE